MFELASRIQNANLTRAEAGAALRVIDCLIFLWKHRLDAVSLKNFPAPTVRLISVSVIAVRGNGCLCQRYLSEQPAVSGIVILDGRVFRP